MEKKKRGGDEGKKSTSQGKQGRSRARMGKEEGSKETEVEIRYAIFPPYVGNPLPALKEKDGEIMGKTVL